MDVTLIDGFTGEAARYVRVELGVKQGDGRFEHNGSGFAVVDQGVTGFTGKTKVHNGTTALHIRTPGWSLHDSADGDTSVEVDLGEEARLVLVNEEPDLPDNLGELVGGLLRTVTQVRILVLQGMHFGCQAAALELVRNLRRVGYRGPITVMVDQNPLPYESKYKLRFDLFGDRGAQTGALQFSEMLTHSLRGRYSHPATVAVQPPVDRHLSAAVNLIPDNGIQVDEAAATLAGALARDCPPAVRVTVTDGKGTTRQADSGGIDIDATPTGTFDVELCLTSISEISIEDKLNILEPGRAELPIFDNVTWLHGTSFPRTDDNTVLGMLACGEYTYHQDVDTYSDALGTPSVLAFQPSNWKVNDRYLRLEGRTRQLCLPRASTYQTEPIELAHLDELVLAAMGERQLGPAKRIISLLRSVTEGAMDLLVIYGLHQVRGAGATQLLTNLRSAVLLTEPRKPCAVLVLYKYDLGEDFSALPSLVTMGDRFEGVCFLHERTPLPQSVFQLLCQASTLPMVIGGANTSNLIRMLGKPHLSVEGGKPFQVPGNEGHLQVHELETLLRTPELRIEGLVRVAKFLDLARTAPDHVCDGYFAVLRDWLRHPKRDQLRLGLYKLALELKSAQTRAVEEDDSDGEETELAELF